MLPAELNAKYELRGSLGAGAMGRVYDATDRIMERRVAIKVVDWPKGDDEAAAEGHARFQREAQAAGRLSHAHIVGVYDYGENADQAWIVMELVDGGSLKGMMDSQVRFPVSETVRLMCEMLDALAYSHNKGVVHRDIKPANVMLARGTDEVAHVKLADFGIARLENSSMTQVGTVMGTPSYMAPEQLRGEVVDLRADIWAAGVVLYQMLTGEKPFEGGFSALMHKALNTMPTPPSVLSVTAPVAFDAVIAKALAKRPEDRFQSARAFAEAIRVAAGGPRAEAAGNSDATFVAAPKDAAKGTASPAPGSIVGVGTEGPVDRGGRRNYFSIAMAFGLAASVLVAGGAWLIYGGPSGKSSPGPLSAPSLPPPPDHRKEIEETLKSLACSVLDLDETETGFRISGLMRPEDVVGMVAEIERRGVPRGSLRVETRAVVSLHCRTLDIVAALRRPIDAPTVTLLGATPIAKGELLRFDVSMPAFSGHISATYLMLSGDVVHIVPGREGSAGAGLRFGDPTVGFAGWEIDEPFGTDLLIVLASEIPFFEEARPDVEREPEFTPALGARLRALQARGARVGVQLVPVETVQRR
jgi:serine/threonine-protein kinase